jgi:hypothetical protein
MVPDPTIATPDRPPLTVRAEGADAVARLRRRAELLRRAAHPGVVELRSWHDEGTVGTLHLTDPGDRRLDTHPPTDPVGAAHLVAALASTIADLHAIGIAHCSLHSSEVALDDRDRPVLCGFDAARSTLDPGAASADVVALGDILEFCTTAAGRSAPRTTRRLRSIGERARSGEPTAREIAAECAEAATLEPVPRSAMPAVAGLLAVAAALAWWNTSTDGSPVGTPSTSSAPATTVPAAAPGPTLTPAPQRPMPATSDEGEMRPVLVHAGSTFRVGLPGDRWAIGDWRCSGHLHPAVLRPATGAVFVFDDWATTSSTVTVAALSHHAGATDIQARRRGDCDDLVLTTPTGTVTVQVPGLGR